MAATYTLKLQAPTAERNFNLPPLRQDINLYPGPDKPDGSPTWSLHDPVNNRFFRIGWLEFEMLSRWRSGNAQALIKQINDGTTLQAELSHVLALVDFLKTNQLLQVRGKEAINELYGKALAGRKHIASWLLQNYLFLRIPLVRPDRFLTRTLPWIQFVYTRGFALALVTTTLLGLYLVMRQWESFQRTFLYFFTLEGLMLFAVAVFIAKVIHELGHAYTAKRYGVRIPTMGLALLVLWPVLYTDTSEAWKLPRRRQRLAIAAAGMAAELALASMATLLWSFLPDGPLRSAVFMIATSSWVVTLFINLNPFMRFDGYYLLSDLVEVQNLQNRSFAVGKWKLRQWILGSKEPPPDNFNAQQRKLIIAYAYSVWIYRFFLFLGIALLVYYFFFKVAGVFLMVTEVTWFIARPVYRELRVWYEMRDRITWNRHTITSVLLVVLLIFALAYPMSTSVHVPAVLKYATYTQIHAPNPSRVENVYVSAGDHVQAGQLLISLGSPELDYKETQAQLRVATLKEHMLRQSADAALLETQQVVQQQLVEAMTELDGYRREQAQLQVTAPYPATVIQWDADVQPGRWINENLRLGLLVDENSAAIQGYVEEKDVGRLEVGRSGRFFPDNLDQEPLDVQLVSIDQVNSSSLDEPYLASVYDGPLPVNRTEKGELVSDSSLFRLHLALQSPLSGVTQISRGTVFLEGEAESLLGRAWQFVSAVLVRESGF
ncbi:MAG: biotin/lipoyl-binding protein [Gammaproteobacteria bacterium]|nr:biotin/lipoyl-binding protein [Gammaproteobacteria bacterium]